MRNSGYTNTPLWKVKFILVGSLFTVLNAPLTISAIIFNIVTIHIPGGERNFIVASENIASEFFCL